MDSLDSAPPYVLPTAHPHLQLQDSRCHPTHPFVQVAPKPHFAFDSPSLDLTGQIIASSHPFHLAFNDNLLSTTHPRVASSCQPSHNDFGLQHYLPIAEKGERCTRTPDQNPINTWPLPPGAGRLPAMITGRPWPKDPGLTPQMFLPGGDTQPYSSYLLEPRDGSPNFSPGGVTFNQATLPTVATPILTTDAPRLREQPQDLVVYFSGSESDSGQEPDDERSTFRDARQDQWTSISTASPRARSPAMTSSCRPASLLATEVPSAHPLFIHRFILLSPP